MDIQIVANFGYIEVSARQMVLFYPFIFNLERILAVKDWRERQLTVQFVIPQPFNNIFVRLMELASHSLDHITYEKQIILRNSFRFEEFIRHTLLNL